IVSDVRPSRRALAQQMGMPVVVDPSTEELYTVVVDHTGGRGAEVGIQAVRLAPALQQSVQALASGRTVVWGGLAPVGLTIPISPNEMFMPEDALRASWGGIELFERTIRTEQRIDWTPTMTEVFPRDQVSDAVEYARTTAAGK